MRRLTALAIAAALLLTGCSAAPAPAPTVTVTVTPTAAADEPTASAGPVEVEAAPEESPAADLATGILVAIQLTMDSYDVGMKAPEIRAASDYVCDQIAAGVPEDQIVAITGEAPAQANADLVQLAADEYCPVR